MRMLFYTSRYLRNRVSGAGLVEKSRNSPFGKRKEGGAGERIFRRNKSLTPLLNP